MSHKFIFAVLLSTLTVNTKAQLVNSLNISTGFNNVTNTVMPLAQQDPNWKVTKLTTPLVAAGTLPYGGYTQDPWNYATPLPVTAPDTRWLSYSSDGMFLGPSDNIGGSITFSYQFELCMADTVVISGTVRSDNSVPSIKIDGVSTGFSQPINSDSWTIGTPFSYTAVKIKGLHTIEVEVKNVGTGQTNNPIGLNMTATLSTKKNSIIDRDNHPGYTCSETAVQNLQDNAGILVYQNQPNPFNSYTEVKFDIKSTYQEAFVVLYDLTGKVIKKYPVTNRQGNIYIDGTELNAGLYIYSLIVDGLPTSGKKMIVTK